MQTKQLTLEELDTVFNIPTRKHASFQLRQADRWFKKKVLRKDIGPPEYLSRVSNQNEQKKAVP